MNRIEAKWLLLRSLAGYHRHGYEKLRLLVGEDRREHRKAASGREYQMEFNILWDAQPEGDIRVLASIDDGGWRAVFPLTYGCLVSPPQTI